MKIEGGFSMLINREETTIEIRDKNASITFIRVKLTPEQLSAVLSRQMSVECEVDVYALDKIGKVHENKTMEFEIPESLASSKHANDLQKLAQSELSDGWIAESYFGSQGSFFKKEGKQYARVTIRRWQLPF